MNSSIQHWIERLKTAAGREDAWESLSTRREDGGLIQPLYTASDLPPDPGHPGQAPYIRGAQRTRDPEAAWSIITPLAQGDAEATTAALRADLDGGATGATGNLHRACFTRDAIKDEGLCLRNLEDLEATLGELCAPGKELHLDAGPLAREIALGWLALANRRGLRGDQAKLFGLCDFSRSFLSHNSDQLSLLRDLIQLADEEMKASRPLSASTLRFHQAGATTAESIGFALANFAELLRLGQSANITPARIAARTILRFEVGMDLFEGIAALRALRKLWSQLLASAGVEDIPAPAIHAFTSLRCQSTRDLEVNLLRATTQGLAAVLGGADQVTIRPYDEALGNPLPLSRRIARNLQHLMMTEAGLGRVIDPFGGSYYVEALTEALAREGYAVLQRFEAHGGLFHAMKSGLAQDIARQSAERRAQRIRTKKQPILGLSEFATNDALVAREPLEKILKGLCPEITEVQPKTLAERGIRVAKNDDFAASLKPLSTEALSPLLVCHRDGEAFEALRLKSDTLTQAGRPPRVLLLSVGPRTTADARLQFAKNLFLSGGFQVAEQEATAPLHPAELVCLCGSEEEYAKPLEPLLERLRQCGVQRVLLAGKARAGILVDDFLFAGVDAVAFLDRELARLAS